MLEGSLSAESSPGMGEQTDKYLEVI